MGDDESGLIVAVEVAMLCECRIVVIIIDIVFVGQGVRFAEAIHSAGDGVLGARHLLRNL